MTEELRTAVRELMPRAREDLSALVAMKSVADARQYPPEECAAAAHWVLEAFRAQGFADIEAIETSDGSAAVVGRRPGPGGAPTVLCTATTTFSRPEAKSSGAPRLSRSPSATDGGTDGALPTARATSSCI